MKTISLKQTSLLVSTVAVMLSSNQLLAKAEILVSSSTGGSVSATAQRSTSALTPSSVELAAMFNDSSTASTRSLTETPVPGTALTSATTLSADVASEKSIVAQIEQTPPSTTTPLETSPGTTAPDATIQDQTTPTQTTPDTTAPDTTTPDTTAPVQTAPATTPDALQVSPGRATRSGSSYFGIGGNIGLGSGGTALGDGSFAILSKIGLTRNFSVRPSLLVSDDVTILLPITLDFSLGAGPASVTEPLGFSVAPYVGIGPAISTGDGASADLLLTGGVDIPITPQFTATASVNATVTGKPAVGLMLGIGYNFAGF